MAVLTSRPHREPTSLGERRPRRDRGRAALTAEPSERELVERAQRGEQNAIERLYLRNVDRVWGCVYTTVRNHHCAEEITQEVFVRMLERLHTYEWRDLPFSAWLLRIAHNAAIDRMRRRGYGVVDGPPRERDAAPSAEHLALQRIARETLDEALDQLPLSQKQTLVLRFFCDLSLRETAAVQGKTVGAVKLLQQRGIAGLAAGERMTLRANAG
jgi:RNA polymerase sigma-70 factor (ECF subfamily)